MTKQQKTMYLNIIHRPFAREDLFRAFCFQQDEAHRMGFRTTIMVTLPNFSEKKIIDYVKNQHELYGDEIALGINELQCREFRERFGTEEDAFFLLSFDMKKEVFSYLMETFKSAFGFYPKSLGFYFIDSRFMTWAKQNYPCIETAITNCFEEGVHMFLGNKSQWYLFSEGGPWGAYYPSKRNILCPAVNEDDAIGIVGLPHLNRDMLMAIVSRDDLFSSHPANVTRGRGFYGDQCPYLYRFVDEWLKQLDYNSFGYYNIFVSPYWLADGYVFEYPNELNRKFYTETLEYLKSKADENRVTCATMQEFAAWYKENIKIDTPEVNLWQDILCGSKRQMFWYVDSSFRVTIDANCGGSIYDLRPYAGGVERNLGPDTPHLANGMYPFLISAEHRGGLQDGSLHTLKITYNGETTSITERRTRCSLHQELEGCYTVNFEPVTLQLGNLTFDITSSYRFARNGRIEIERTVTNMSDPEAEITLTEYHRGCYGTTIYPEDMRGIRLAAKGTDDTGEESLNYEYKCRILGKKSPEYLTADIPQIETSVSLIPLDGADWGEAREGYLFRPFYSLSLSKNVRNGGKLKSCLEVKHLCTDARPASQGI